jgi:predicted Rossmann-fold nucleotide-binding protein
VAAYVASQNKIEVNGGGPGVMGAATMGAKSKNG